MATIRKRGNSYLIRVYNGYDTNGTQIEYSKTWKPDKNMTDKQKEKTVQKIAMLFEEQCLRGLYLDSSMKFEQFAELWLHEYADKQLRKTTVFNYRNMAQVINKGIGHIRMNRIQPHHLIRFYDELKNGGRKAETSQIPQKALFDEIEKLQISKNELSRRLGISHPVISAIFRSKAVSATSARKISAAFGKSLDCLFKPSETVTGTKLSGKTVLNYHRLISSIMETAVKWQIVISNPCKRVAPPKAEHREARFLDEEQAAKILNLAENETTKFRAIVTLLLYSGMRRGELCGLTWSDIDFKNGIIDINKSSLYLSGIGVFDDVTKNKSSSRSIKLPRLVIDTLLAWRTEQSLVCLHSGAAWFGDRGPACKVFTQGNGKPMHPTTVSKLFHNFIEKYNLPKISVHSLRHTNATLMIAAGIDVKTVSKRLGHAQTSTTTNIYSHAIRTADEIAAETIDDILTPKTAREKRI